jgi:hypothetical protein
MERLQCPWNGRFNIVKMIIPGLAVVVHIYNPSYSKGRDGEDQGLRSAGKS